MECSDARLDDLLVLSTRVVLMFKKLVLARSIVKGHRTISRCQLGALCKPEASRSLPADIKQEISDPPSFPAH